MDMLDLVSRYRDGQRDFHGADLRGARLGNADLCGIDLSGADLRGADFSGARLEGAKLSGVRCGALRHWRILRGGIGLLAGGLSGLMMSIVAILWAAIGTMKALKPISPWLSLILGPLVAMSLWLWVRRGSVAVVVAVAVAFTIIVGVGVGVGGAGAGAGAGIFVVAVAVGVAGAGAGAIAFAAAGAGAFAVAAAVTVAVAMKDKSQFFTLLVTLVAQLIAVWLVRRRALIGIPEHAWARDLTIAIRAKGGTRFYRADLGGTDFTGADLHGADLRGADLDGSCFLDVRGLDRARLDAGDLRKLPMQQLLISGVGARQDFSGMRFGGISLRKADLSDAYLRGADLGGVDLSEACLDGAFLDKARIDARTYARSGWTPRILAALHKRGVEVVALEAFPPAAQDVVVGLRDGLVLSFGQPLTHFRQHLIEGSLYAIVGIESNCRIGEYREKDDGTSFVRIVGADRAELERVAEAFYRRVWEETKTSSARELSRINELLSDALRQRLSELVRDLVEIELRQPGAAPTGSTALIQRGSESVVASEPVWRWDQRIDRVSFFGQRPRRAVILHGPSKTDRGLCEELLKHMAGLNGQGLLETFHSAAPGEMETEIFAAEIAKADVVLVLVSSEFLADAACQDRLDAALRAEEAAGKPLAVPIVLRPCDWQASSLGGRQCLPEGGQPVTSWGKSAVERDAGWVEVISTLRRHLLSMSTSC